MVEDDFFCTGLGYSVGYSILDADLHLAWSSLYILLKRNWLMPHCILLCHISHLRVLFLYWTVTWYPELAILMGMYTFYWCKVLWVGMMLDKNAIQMYLLVLFVCECERESVSTPICTWHYHLINMLKESVNFFPMSYFNILLSLSFLILTESSRSEHFPCAWWTDKSHARSRLNRGFYPIQTTCHTSKVSYFCCSFCSGFCC